MTTFFHATFMDQTHMPGDRLVHDPQQTCAFRTPRQAFDWLIENAKVRKNAGAVDFLSHVRDKAVTFKPPFAMYGTRERYAIHATDPTLEIGELIRRSMIGFGMDGSFAGSGAVDDLFADEPSPPEPSVDDLFADEPTLDDLFS